MFGVLDVTIITGKTTLPPAGYTKLAVDLNVQAGGDFIYACIKTGNCPPNTYGVTDLTVVEGKSSSAPFGYTLIPTDLNKGASGATLYLCKKLEANQPIIKDVAVVAGSKTSAGIAPSGYTQIPIDLNKGSGGYFVYMYQLRSTIADMCAVSDNLSLPVCKARCLANQGSCDAQASSWCATHPTDVFCACLTSKIADVKYGINPKCVDAACMQPGVYLSSASNATQCPSIVNCSIQQNIKNTGVMIGTSVTLEQNCSGGGTVTPPVGGGGTTTQPTSAWYLSTVNIGGKDYTMLTILMVVVFLVVLLITGGVLIAFSGDDDEEEQETHTPTDTESIWW